MFYGRGLSCLVFIIINCYNVKCNIIFVPRCLLEKRAVHVFNELHKRIFIEWKDLTTKNLNENIINFSQTCSKVLNKSSTKLKVNENKIQFSRLVLTFKK